MASIAHLSVLILCSLFLKVESQILTINVTQQGDYTIAWKDGTVWLRSAPTFFVIDNVTYSAADSTLTLEAVNTTEPSAGYLIYNLYYRANDTDILASIHVYYLNYIGFTVTFQDGANNTRVASPDDVICGFPGFRVDPSPARLAYLSYGMSTFEGALGRWENGSAIVYGGRQGSGPLILFDKNNKAIAMGPRSSFTVTSLWHDVEQGFVYWGIMGSVAQLPAGFQYGITMVGNEGRVGFTLSMWGLIVKSDLLKQEERPDVSAIPVPGNLLGSLGYWTGPGSAYYAGPEPGKTYEDTLVDVRLYAANNTRNQPRIAYLHVEVDDWWYVKGQNGGVKTWSAPASVFPDGIGGMSNKTKWQVAAACGVWAPDNTYAKQNNGQYDFVMGDACALPNDQKFWDDLFNQNDQNRLWAFVQKNMEQQFLCMTSGDTDVDTVTTWLGQLNVTISQKNMEVMYSGAIPRLAMEAAFRHTAHPVVQVGSEAVTVASHWKVGVANIFIDALDLRSFTGIVKSYTNESGTSPTTELSPLMYNVLATLSGGPVAIGDEIGQSDRQIIERCCNAEGRVLSPLRPAKAIDAQLQQLAWGGDVGTTGEIWTTFTTTSFAADVGGGELFHGIIMATGMTRSFDITPTSAGFIYTDGVVKATKLYSWDNAFILHDFTDDKPFTLNCTDQEFCLYHVAPVLTIWGKEVVFLGDTTKWVPMSAQRIERVKLGVSHLDVYTRGEPEEKVYMYFHIDNRLQSLEGRIGDDGTGMIKYELGPIGPSGAAQRSASVNYVIVLCASLLTLLTKI